MSIQGQVLEITVVGCSKLKDTEWLSRQDPYVCLEYATTKFRTRTCIDGGRNPSFQEKMSISLIEGLREIIVTVWNSNTLTYDDFIGSGRVLLHKVLAEGYDDSSWSIQSRSARFSGEVKLILHYANANKAPKPGKGVAAPMGYHPAAAPSHSPPIPYPVPPPYASPYIPSKSLASPYAPAGYSPAAYPPVSVYPTPPQMYPQPQPQAQPQAQTYPPTVYPPPPYPQTYPPAPFPGIYPPPPRPY